MNNKNFNRRNFVKRIIYLLLSIEIIYVFVNVLRKNNTKTKTNNWFEAGNIRFFKNNKVYPFGSQQFYISRLEDGGLLAISTKCTHLGCTVQFNTNKDKFVCPCHASAFDKYGEVLSPPATRALDIYPIEIREDRVLVDVSRPIKRTQYEANQLTYNA